MGLCRAPPYTSAFLSLFAIPCRFQQYTSIPGQQMKLKLMLSTASTLSQVANLLFFSDASWEPLSGDQSTVPHKFLTRTSNTERRKPA